MFKHELHWSHPSKHWLCPWPWAAGAVAFYYKELKCDVQMRETGKQFGVWVRDRGRTGEREREGWGLRAVTSHSVCGMVYSTLELMQMQAQPLNLLPSLRILLALGNDGGQRWGKVSLSGMNPQTVPPWSEIPQEAMLMSVAHGAASDHDEAWDPCGHMSSMPICCLREPCWCEWHVTTWGHVEVQSPFSYWRPWVGQRSWYGPVLMSRTCVTTEAQADAPGGRWCLKPCECRW